MEIGGFFEFPKLDCDDPDDSSYTYLKNAYGQFKFVRDGRQAIKSVLLNIKNINNITCYLPSYLCDSILKPFNELNLKVKFYDHDEVLNPVIDNIKDSLIYVIDYFGVESISNKEIYEILDKDNILILDTSHSNLNHNRYSVESENFYIISSLRKIFPIPDGGIVYHSLEQFSSNLPAGFPEGYEKRLEAMVLRGFYLKGLEIDMGSMESAFDDDKLESMVGDFNAEKVDNANVSLEDLKKHYLSMYYDYEFDKFKKNVMPQNIPTISLHILNNISQSNIVEKRNENLKFVYQEIQDQDLFLFDFKQIKCPFMLPLKFRTENERNSVKTTLIDNKIYPQILWEIEKYVPKKYSYAHDLSRKILMIPIDQRYDSNDLSKVTKTLNRHYL
jgi:hypothetical protein